MLTNNFAYKEEAFMNKKIKDSVFISDDHCGERSWPVFLLPVILLPNDAIDYGTAGIAIIISKLTGYNLSLCVLLVFLPFLIAGVILIGKYFFAKTFVGFVVYTIGLSYFEKIPFELNTEHFIAVAFGGAILGVGLSLILRNGGCIDGF